MVPAIELQRPQKQLPLESSEADIRAERVELINAVKEAFDWFLSSGSFRIRCSDSLRDRIHSRILRSLLLSSTTKFVLSKRNAKVNVSELSDHVFSSMQRLSIISDDT